MSPRALLAHSSLTAIFILLSIFLTILGEHQQYVRDEQAAVKTAGTGTPDYGVFSYLFTAVQSEAQYCLDLVKAKVRPGQLGQNDPADARGRPTSEESFNKRRPTSKESLKNLSRVLQAPSGGKATPSGRRPSQRELSKISSSTSPEQARLTIPEIGNAGLNVLLANQQVLLKQMLSEQKEIKAEQREIKAELSTAQSTWLRTAQTTSAPHASSADEITDRAAVADATIVELLLEQKRIAERVAKKKFEVAPAHSAINEEPGSAKTTSLVGERKHGHSERRKKEAHRSPHRGASTDVALLSSLEVNESLAFRRARNRHSHSKAESEPGSPTKYTNWMDGSEHGSEPPSPPASVCNSTGRKRRHRKHKGTDAASRTEAAAAAEAAAATVASAAGSSASKANNSLFII